jgi:hypothetical protein
LDTTLHARAGTHSPRGDVRALWLGIAFSALFTGVIWLTGFALKSFPHLPQQGPSWYFWKLSARSLPAELSVWGLYAAHQLSLGGIIWYAQTHVKKYTTGLHTINKVALGVNAFFIVLHLVQTHLWYDGLAQDVSVYSSQGSVIVLLLWVLLMENNRRGPGHLWELTAIPLIDYLAVIVLALLIGLIVRVTHWQRSPNAVTAQS